MTEPAGATPPRAAQARPGPWLALCAGVLLGTAVQLQQPVLSPALAYAVLALGGAAVLVPAWRAGRRGLAAGAALLAAAALAFGGVGLRALAFQAQALDPALEGRDLVLTGRVAAMPQPGDIALRLRLQVEAAQDDGVPVRVPPLVELSWYYGSLDGRSQQVPQVLAGDRWRVQARLRAVHGQRNPHGFDHELWQWERGVQATGYVRAGPRDAAPERLERGWHHPVERARQAVREAIFARIAEPGRAGLVAALAMGDQSAVERADWDLFRATGVAHLLAVSGLHVTMFAWLATAVLGWAWRRSARACLWCPAPHAALVGGVALAGAYAVFSGWGVPAQRTLIMLAAVAALRLAGRRWPWPRVLLLAAALVVLLDPWALLQAGFWLSFVAVGVLFAGAGAGAPEAGGARPQGMGRRAASALGRLLREQAVVTVALAPLSLMLFQQVSLVGLLANLAAIPWVTLVLTPLALLGVLAAPLWDLAAGATGLLLALLAWCARWPLASIDHAALPWPLGAAAIAGALLLVLRWPAGLRLAGLPLLLPALCWQPPRPPAGEFELLAADVGQGNAVLVRTAGHALLYDTGPRYGQDSDAGHRVLVPLLRALGERLDRVVVSHADSDHSGGAAAVLAMQPQAELLASLPQGHALRVSHAFAPCRAGQRWQWDGVQFEVLHPAEDDGPPGEKPNARSCVLRIANGRAAALLAGDIEQPQEARLLAGAAPLQADWLLVAHHGSKTSSSAAWLGAVAPRIAMVQAGYRNRFGHPAPEVVRRLQAQGAAVVTSTQCGAARWRSDAPAAVDCERLRDVRYWQHRPD
ncbi:DNA internalization-related competence protein ComEC/Rec2 [Pseudorhodoferax sp.]|uniref:DNA internalization-related competence protein ComEC/Rec2 n=1 Tax=Pseudorhodoferax sp. TaxID=1993553 RepID=UPI0039E3C748